MISYFSEDFKCNIIGRHRISKIAKNVANSENLKKKNANLRNCQAKHTSQNKHTHTHTHTKKKKTGK